MSLFLVANSLVVTGVVIRCAWGPLRRALRRYLFRGKDEDADEGSDYFDEEGGTGVGRNSVWGASGVRRRGGTPNEPTALWNGSLLGSLPQPYTLTGIEQQQQQQHQGINGPPRPREMTASGFPAAQVEMNAVLAHNPPVVAYAPPLPRPEARFHQKNQPYPPPQLLSPHPLPTATAAVAQPAAPHHHEIDPSELTIGARIGGGSFGDVYKASWRGTPVAVKLLRPQGGPALPADAVAVRKADGVGAEAGGGAGAGAGGAGGGVGVVDAGALQEFSSEVAMLARLRHPNVCLFMGCCLRPERNYFAIVTELVGRGSLWDVLREPRLDEKRRQKQTPTTSNHQHHHSPPFPPMLASLLLLPLASRSSAAASPSLSSPRHSLLANGHEWSWERVHQIANGIVCGMAYLHGNKPTAVLHRDLKSSNLLCDESYCVKIADFGMSRLKASATASMLSSSPRHNHHQPHPRKHMAAAASTRLQQAAMTGNCGTVQWMAPEVLSNDKYSETADVFSFGVILWELLVRECPYEGRTQVSVALGVVQQALRPQFPAWCPPQYKALVERCWHQDPAKRPSFKALLLPCPAAAAQHNRQRQRQRPSPSPPRGGEGGDGETGSWLKAACTPDPALAAAYFTPTTYDARPSAAAAAAVGVAPPPAPPPQFGAVAGGGGGAGGGRRGPPPIVHMAPLHVPPVVVPVALGGTAIGGGGGGAWQQQTHQHHGHPPPAPVLRPPPQLPMHAYPPPPYNPPPPYPAADHAPYPPPPYHTPLNIPAPMMAAGLPPRLPPRFNAAPQVHQHYHQPQYGHTEDRTGGGRSMAPAPLPQPPAEQGVLQPLSFRRGPIEVQTGLWPRGPI